MFGNLKVRKLRSKWQVDLALHNAFETAGRHGPAFERLVLHIRQHSDMLRTLPVGGCPGWIQADRFIGGLLSQAEFHADWLQDLESWEPRAESAYSQFASLARHLFAKSPVPNFMTSAWFEGRSRDALRHQSWFRHLGLGHGIRGVETPIKLTKIMARQFLQARDHYLVIQALRWGQIRGFGADEPLADAIVATRLGSSFDHDEYWSQVIRFLIDNPCFGTSNVASIIEYLNFNRRLLKQHAPGLLKRKKADAFLQEVKRWRSEPVVMRRSTSLKWKATGIDGLDYLDEQRVWDPRQWTIRELLDSNDLLDEGRNMRHCVGTYGLTCCRGDSSIWSMTCSDSSEQNRRELTIEVDPTEKAIVQARGLRNSRPTPEARRVMLLWAEREGLKVESWV